MLILAIIVFGLLAGGLAQLVLGRSMRDVNWTIAIVTGLVGSFVGGLLVSLLAGDGLELRPSGLIGSFVGALLLTLAWGWWDKRRGAA
ncbi:GlsB/YeaQ/YmgE family stress response membrane protein [Nocardioides pinisoli]|uniref:GlsB/YeaQ/YmgE family stress response membrane protein n=1 Tax=Nocardioides pinisoli TaxID=2950279 RepID=A0ABT1L2P7_9ACTN|nr:GlsB/YeaQ/YmgE family stress response membrane protein [Nocardioides pinisoli]MCP3424294.1 GlsB/YeaQ/YmgE family stress response membrane protein [Nocardioides pinisoli]